MSSMREREERAGQVSGGRMEPRSVQPLTEVARHLWIPGSHRWLLSRPRPRNGAPPPRSRDRHRWGRHPPRDSHALTTPWVSSNRCMESQTVRWIN